MHQAPGTRHQIRDFVRGTLGTGGAVLARAAGSLIVNKLFATLAPAGGLTLLAQFQNLMALLTAVPNDGVHVGLVKYLAPLRPGSPRYRAWLGAAITLNLLALLAGGAVLLASGWAGWGMGARLLIVLGIGLVTVQALLSAALVAAGRLAAFVGLTVALAALGTAGAAGALLRGWAVGSALLAYLLAQGLAAGPALALAHRAGLLGGLRLRRPGSPAARRGLGRFLLMALSSLLFGKAVDFALRAYLLAHFGPARADLWQTVAKLSDNYTMVFAAVMSSVFYPRLAALMPRPAAARAYRRAVLLLLAPTLAGGLGLIYALRDWLLPLLFAPRLLAARELLAPQLLGDGAKFLSWVFIFQLSAQARTGRYVAVQAASAGVFAALLAGLLPTLGLAGAVWAHAARYGLLLAWCAVFLRGK